MSKKDELLADNLVMLAALQRARNLLVDDLQRPNGVSLKEKDDVLRQVRSAITSNGRKR